MLTTIRLMTILFWHMHFAFSNCRRIANPPQPIAKANQSRRADRTIVGS
jgi:hypothetical protein